MAALRYNGLVTGTPSKDCRYGSQGDGRVIWFSPACIGAQQETLL